MHRPLLAVLAGGGHPDVKLRVFVSQLLRPGVFGGALFAAPIVECTTLRDDEEIAGVPSESDSA
ncbi:hypothetical protein EON66_08790 [archaeon]|nr:MAG: hypothetical protein EON66_08790 [archaeon]